MEIGWVCDREATMNADKDRWGRWNRLGLPVLICGFFCLFVVPHQLAAAPPAAVLKKPAQSNAPKSDEVWQVIYFGEERIGYSHASESNAVEDNRSIIRSETETHLALKRFGQDLKIVTVLNVDELPTGELLAFKFEMRNPPASSTRITGQLAAKENNPNQQELVIETTTAGRKHQSKLPWDPEIKSPVYQDRLLRDNPLKPGEVRTFKTYVPELNKLSTVRLTADNYETVSLLGNQSKKLLRVRVDQTAAPEIVVRAFLDEHGNALKTESPFLGMSMLTYVVSKEEALKALTGAELDIAVNTLVHVPLIRNAHRTSKVEYKITIPGEDPSKYVVADGTQRVEKLKDSTISLTVSAVAMPETALRATAANEYLEPSQFVQSQDYRVKEHAQRAAAGESNPARAALRMEKYVHDKLKSKNFSTALASAAEVAESMEGDCTEHAVLLAAMLRAQQIPSRIAVGLVYVERQSCFGGHMWTEAKIGETWVPLDATLGRGGIGAAHIKLVESSFSDEGAAPVTAFLPLLNVLGNIQIEVVSQQ